MPNLKFIFSKDAKPHPKQHRAPCSDCPFSRESVPGWLGSMSVEQWHRAAHSDCRIDCHTRKRNDAEHWQCAGAAIYRANVIKRVDPPNLELPKNLKLVFGFSEFDEHHKAGLFGKIKL